MVKSLNGEKILKFVVRCPKCNSFALWKYGSYMTKEGKKQKFKCVICGHIWSKKIKC